MHFRDQLDAMEASRLSKNSSRRKRQVHKYNPKWTNNHVYYYFDPNTGETGSTSVYRGISALL